MKNLHVVFNVQSFATQDGRQTHEYDSLYKPCDTQMDNDKNNKSNNDDDYDDDDHDDETKTTTTTIIIIMII